MSKTMTIVLAFAVLAAVAGSGTVYAQRCHGGFGERFTEEQRDAIHGKIEEMRTAGASREEIHEAVREMLESWGITPPEGPPEGRRRGMPFGERFTEEQRDAIHGKIEEMRTAGASREEIHEAVREMLEGWGITPPEGPPDAGSGRALSPEGSLGKQPGESKEWGEIKGEFE